MKHSMISAISVILILGINNSVAHAEESVSCVPKLSVDIANKEGSMEYSVDVVVKNTTNEHVESVVFALMTKDGTPIGGQSTNVYLFPNQSGTKGLWAGGKYKVEWSEDPEIRKRQEIDFEKVRQEKQNNLKGAYCKLVSFGSNGWSCSQK